MAAPGWGDCKSGVSRGRHGCTEREKTPEGAVETKRAAQATAAAWHEGPAAPADHTSGAPPAEPTNGKCRWGFRRDGTGRTVGLTGNSGAGANAR